MHEGGDKEVVSINDVQVLSESEDADIVFNDSSDEECHKIHIANMSQLKANDNYGGSYYFIKEKLETIEEIATHRQNPFLPRVELVDTPSSKFGASPV